MSDHAPIDGGPIFTAKMDGGLMIRRIAAFDRAFFLAHGCAPTYSKIPYATVSELKTTPLDPEWRRTAWTVACEIFPWMTRGSLIDGDGWTLLGEGDQKMVVEFLLHQ